MMLFTITLSSECCKSVDSLVVQVATFSKLFCSKPSRPVLQELKTVRSSLNEDLLGVNVVCTQLIQN